MKKVLISIESDSVSKILECEKTSLLTKTFPKCDLPCEVYIYCSEGNDNLWRSKSDRSFLLARDGGAPFTFVPLFDAYDIMNGKVIAKFKMQKAERFVNGRSDTERLYGGNVDSEYDYFAMDRAMRDACVDDEWMDSRFPDLSFYEWRIWDLEIFDEPMKLNDFVNKRKELQEMSKPPKGWQYVELKEEEE